MLQDWVWTEKLVVTISKAQLYLYVDAGLAGVLVVMIETPRLGGARQWHVVGAVRGSTIYLVNVILVVFALRGVMRRPASNALRPSLMP